MQTRDKASVRGLNQFPRDNTGKEREGGGTFKYVLSPPSKSSSDRHCPGELTRALAASL